MQKKCDTIVRATDQCSRFTEKSMKCRKFHYHGNLYMYPYVSGEFKPVERQANASSFGKSGRDEAGMGH